MSQKDDHKTIKVLVNTAFVGGSFVQMLEEKNADEVPATYKQLKDLQWHMNHRHSTAGRK